MVLGTGRTIEYGCCFIPANESEEHQLWSDQPSAKCCYRNWLCKSACAGTGRNY